MQGHRGHGCGAALHSGRQRSRTGQDHVSRAQRGEARYECPARECPAYFCLPPSFEAHLGIPEIGQGLIAIEPETEGVAVARQVEATGQGAEGRASEEG
jgi:hypothetical protein